jgi:hypothetical protein
VLPQGFPACCFNAWRHFSISISYLSKSPETPQMENFAVYKFNIPKCGLIEFCQTEIASVKRAVCELKFRQVFVGKVAIVENAVFVFALCQQIASVKGFVYDVIFLHL